jgi:hypothetical protein
VLKKGDYLLSTAYEMKTAYVSWNDGKELSLANLRNLTIRGAEGARILSDSNLSAIIGIYDSSNVTFDDIRFVRLLKTGSDVGAGSVYAESVQGLTLDRCSFEGPTTIAIELWKCVDATIRRSLVSGAVSRALSASYTRGLELGASRVSNCEGHPLIYLRSSDNVSIKGTAFEGSTGGNFIEIYAESGSVEAVRFEGSSFRGNQVQYFAGTSILPTTEDCLFADNSFDENWASDSVAPANEQFHQRRPGRRDRGPVRTVRPFLGPFLFLSPGLGDAGVLRTIEGRRLRARRQEPRLLRREGPCDDRPRGRGRLAGRGQRRGRHLRIRGADGRIAQDRPRVLD